MSLRPYQLGCLAKSKERYDAGINRQLAVLATGLGKAVLFAALRQHHGFQKKVMVLVHREELAAQGADKIRRWNPGLMIGVEMGQRRAAPMDTFVVGSVPTLGRAHSPRLEKFDPAEFDCIVSDECFPAGTLIDGVPIENVCVGDQIMSYDESSASYVKKRVARLFRNPAPGTMVVIRAGDLKLICTDNHPIYTDRGWRRAADVHPGDCILFDLSQSSGFASAARMEKAHLSQNRTGVLFGGMQGGLRVPIVLRAHGAHESQARVGADEDEQSHASGRQPGAYEEYAESHGAQAFGPRRERNRLDYCADRNAGVSGGTVGTRGQGSDIQSQRVRISRLLQAGRGKFVPDGRSGVGREFAWTPFETGSGHKEGGIAAFAGVDSVEIQERGSVGEPDALCPDGYVYNLEVEDTHTYFANGLLVHNCHHSTSPQWRRVLGHFNLMAANESPILSLGLTATPNRSDGTGLRICFDEVVYDMGIDKGIGDGYLVDLQCWRVTTKTSLDAVHTSAGDFKQDELADTVNTPERNGMIVKAWAKHAHEKKTIVFTVDVQHALDLAEAFKAYGIAAAAVWGEDPDRSLKLKQHRAGELTVLCNAQVLTEGYDDPGVECIVLAKPTKSALLLTQMIGRGTRLPEGVSHASEIGDYGKQFCIILDVVDATHKHQLATVPSLLGLPKDLDLRGETYRKAQQQIERVAKDFPTANLADLKDLSKLDAIAKQVTLFDVKYPPEIRQMTELAWRAQGEGYFIPVKRDRLTLAKDLRDEWWVRGTLEGKDVELHAQNLAGAFNIADREILKASGGASLMSRDAHWRTIPPSEKQVALCRKLKLNIPVNANRGQVSAALDAYFAGRRA